MNSYHHGYYHIIKVILAALMLVTLSTCSKDISTGKAAFELAGCQPEDDKSVRAVTKNSNKPPCQSMPIVTSAGFPLPFMVDNLTKSGAGEISFNDNFYIKPFLADLAFFVVIVLIALGIKESKILSRLVLLLVVSLILTLLSSYYESSDTISTSGEGYCGDSSPCDVTVITGGYPYQYLYDTLGVSVEGSLSILDTWHNDLFLYDLVFYLVLLSLLMLAKDALKRKDRV